MKSLNYYKHVKGGRKDGSTCWHHQSWQSMRTHFQQEKVEPQYSRRKSWSTQLLLPLTLNNNEKQNQKPLLYSELWYGLGSQRRISQNQVTPFWQLASTTVMCHTGRAHYSSLFVGINNSSSLNMAPPGC